ncbi:hypothetical protein [Pontibacter ramchanderi]|uniref:Uncharacterized protein n=1 Tax=Pontibacter ramchanderi TaxID=1179743 RepID=A0A2N3V429_9BACT|nr:hypothetical protein [Pontibacter ramchanderi]PKV76384.1 hypothetical protein BD749_1337 [Pontibacter ramchanderi]
MKKFLAKTRDTKLYLLLVMCTWIFTSHAQSVEMGRLVTTYTQDFNTLPATGTTAELGKDAFIPDG